MNAEIKAKWLEALRSGKYVQDKSVLKGNAGYCCMGVLAECIMPNRWSIIARGSCYALARSSEVFSHPLQRSTGEQLLTPEALKSVGLNVDVQRELTAKNDNGCSFEEIARVIESCF